MRRLLSKLWSSLSTHNSGYIGSGFFLKSICSQRYLRPYIDGSRILIKQWFCVPRLFCAWSQLCWCHFVWLVLKTLVNCERISALERFKVLCFLSIFILIAHKRLNWISWFPKRKLPSPLARVHLPGSEFFYKKGRLLLLPWP